MRRISRDGLVTLQLDSSINVKKVIPVSEVDDLHLNRHYSDESPPDLEVQARGAPAQGVSCREVMSPNDAQHTRRTLLKMIDEAEECKGSHLS
jgi:hypothetical protein